MVMMMVMLLAQMVVGLLWPTPPLSARSPLAAPVAAACRASRPEWPRCPAGRRPWRGGRPWWLGRPRLGRLGRLPIRPRPGPRPGPRSGVGRQLPRWQLAGFRGAGQQRRRQRRRWGRHRRGVALLASGGGRRWFGGAAAGLRSRVRVVRG